MPFMNFSGMLMHIPRKKLIAWNDLDFNARNDSNYKFNKKHERLYNISFTGNDFNSTLSDHQFFLAVWRNFLNHKNLLHVYLPNCPARVSGLAD